ncbi:SMC family ATPase [Microbacterium sp. 2FI]|uniref:AAA family ATPase n=1 Tax=Microbacterium sp. 2FI TaxID=2502193 RepID=UPI0010F8EC3F|nr:SMC family ATPase [Microbacterium sp. 2FI]
MRLHRLELTGFGPFREQQTVDFDAFAADGIFLIAGRTGAGKSSVLDGVCFGLYGGVPRYEGVEKRLRSDHCDPDDPTSVVVEFSAAGRRWRVTRSPEYDRPKLRGTGMTTEPHRAQLDELIEGVWIGRAARPVDVARELDELLGLNQQQFLQVILLAQNRFAEFLLAKNDDRQRLLRRLFGTRTYEGYQVSLEQRRKDAERELAHAGSGVELLLDEVERMLEVERLAGEPAIDAVPAGLVARDLLSRLAAGAVGIQRADYRAETLVRERDAADTAHRDADAAHVAVKSLREAQEQRQRARTALAAREAAEPLIAEQRHTLARAVDAEALRAPLDAAAQAAAAETAAHNLLEGARAAWRDGVGDGPHDADAGEVADDADEDALRVIVERLTGDLALWAAAAEREAGLHLVDAQLADGAQRCADYERIIGELATALAAYPTRMESLGDELSAASTAAGALDAAERLLAELEQRLVAAHEAERLAAASREAEAAYLAAAEQHDRSRSAVTHLLQRRLAGHAGELAAALVDGEPCAVCGSAEHPAPAAAGDAAVSDEMVAAAEARRDADAAIESRAVAHARTTRETLAEANARSGAAEVATLAADRTVAAAAVETAVVALRNRDRLSAERDELVALERSARAEHEALVAEFAALREKLAATAADAESARRAIAIARGGFASVTARIAHARDRRRRALDLTDALRAAADATARAAAAAADLAARISTSGFTAADDVAAALRDAATRAALAERIREHEVSLRVERDRLRELELELAGAPEELIELEPTHTALTAARDRWTAAVDAAAHASQAATRLAELVARANAAHAAIDGLAEQQVVLVRLADTVAGRAPNTHRMTLESFVLAAELEEIVERANLRLDDMSSGRYRLQHTDARAARNAASGLGLEILDAHTGIPRSAQSLSGGETFLASLSLALGLAEVVTARAGGVQLDTLFIDEGFGSLDDDTLELAMRTLDELRQGGRTVGLISHVAAMKDQLSAQLVVTATPQGPSVISQDAARVS